MMHDKARTAPNERMYLLQMWRRRVADHGRGTVETEECRLEWLKDAAVEPSVVVLT